MRRPWSLRPIGDLLWTWFPEVREQIAEAAAGQLRSQTDDTGEFISLSEFHVARYVFRDQVLPGRDRVDRTTPEMWSRIEAFLRASILGSSTNSFEKETIDEVLQEALDSTDMLAGIPATHESLRDFIGERPGLTRSVTPTPTSPRLTTDPWVLPPTRFPTLPELLLAERRRSARFVHELSPSDARLRREVEENLAPFGDPERMDTTLGWLGDYLWMAFPADRTRLAQMFTDEMHAAIAQDRMPHQPACEALLTHALYRPILAPALEDAPAAADTAAYALDFVLALDSAPPDWHDEILQARTTSILEPLDRDGLLPAAAALRRRILDL